MKIDLLTPWGWKPNYDWLRRDLGLLCEPLAEMGHEPALLLEHTPGMPKMYWVEGCFVEQLHSAKWWAARGSSLVITISGFRPSAIAIHQAIKAAGIPLWNKMDTDGVWGVRVNPGLALHTLTTTALMRKSRLPRLCGLGLFLMRYIFSSDESGIQALAPCDKILVESPLALSRAKAFFQYHGHPKMAEKLLLFPGPTPNDRQFQHGDSKENRIIAVGRWDDFAQKDTPKLLRVLAGFLQWNPLYQADIVGRYDERLMQLHQQLPESIRERIHTHGRIPNEELAAYYRKAKILLCTSRHESVHIASAEAVASGCSVVGPPIIASMGYYAGHASGTVSRTRSDRDMLDALDCEAMEWERGARDPVAISSHFRSEFSATAAAQIVDRNLESL